MELSNIAGVNVSCYNHLEQLFGKHCLLNLTHLHPIILQFQKCMCLCTKRNYRVITVVVFSIAKNWKPPKFLSTVELIGQIGEYSYNEFLQRNEKVLQLCSQHGWFLQCLAKGVTKEHTQCNSHNISLISGNLAQGVKNENISFPGCWLLHDNSLR